MTGQISRSGTGKWQQLWQAVSDGLVVLVRQLCWFSLVFCVITAGRYYTRDLVAILGPHHGMASGIVFGLLGMMLVAGVKGQKR